MPSSRDRRVATTECEENLRPWKSLRASIVEGTTGHDRISVNNYAIIADVQMDTNGANDCILLIEKINKIIF